MIRIPLVLIAAGTLAASMAETASAQQLVQRRDVFLCGRTRHCDNNESEFEGVISNIGREGGGALIALTDAFMSSDRGRLATRTSADCRDR